MAQIETGSYLCSPWLARGSYVSESHLNELRSTCLCFPGAGKVHHHTWQDYFSIYLKCVCACREHRVCKGVSEARLDSLELG